MGCADYEVFEVAETVGILICCVCTGRAGG